MSKRQVITKKELKKIQKYWNQCGGFGGELNSGATFYSETSCFGRVGVLEVEKKDSDECLRIYFYKNDKIEEIQARAERAGLKSFRI